MNGEYDVVIAGGGLVGAALGVALADCGQRVAVVEAFAPTDSQPSFDDRATALAMTSVDILRTLDLWPDDEQVCAIRTIHVSDRGRFGSTRMHTHQHGVQAFGYVIENRVMGDVLWRALDASDVDVFCPARIEAATPQVGGVALKLDGAGARLDTGLLVVAEGALSATRALLDIDVETSSYERTALVTNIATEKPHAGRAFERFTSDGPLAVLPLSRGRSNVVWSVPTAQAEPLIDDDDAFRGALQEAFGYRLGRITQVGTRSRYPLARAIAQQLHGDHWVLVGNAAHAVHPVAGQGLNLGLRDMASLAELIVQRDGGGWPELLARYAAWRAPDHRQVLRMTDSLVKVFAHSAAPVGAARDAALIALQMLPPVRRWFARRSMGYRDALPRLARGVPLSPRPAVPSGAGE
ncbi:MAG: 2-octaprenyl-6-methoxyphenyl hydroxylase [Gammaproteobacteria bacterium]